MKQKEAIYQELSDVNTHYLDITKTSNKLFNICGNIDNNDDETINKNSFFNLYCYNEFVADIYNTDKLKHYETILKDNGFVLSSIGEVVKLNNKKTDEMKNIICSIKNELFADYIIDDDKCNVKYAQINRNVDFLGLNGNSKLAEYQYIVTDEFKLLDHLNVIRMLKNDEYINNKITKMNDNNYDVKSFNSAYHKIKLLRGLEKRFNIDMLDVNYTADDTLIVISDEEYKLIKQLFRTEKTKPKTKKQFKILYVSMIKNICGNEIIKTIQIGKKKISTYNLNGDAIKYHLELDKLGKYHNNFHTEYVERFNIIENKIDVDEDDIIYY